VQEGEVLQAAPLLRHGLQHEPGYLLCAAVLLGHLLRSGPNLLHRSGELLCCPRCELLLDFELLCRFDVLLGSGPDVLLGPRGDLLRSGPDVLHRAGKLLCRTLGLMPAI
jgi:hypothetical protein